MRIGILKHRVTVQEPVETVDELGQPVQSWQTMGTFWASVRNVRGRKTQVADQTVVQASDSVEMRAIPFQLTEKHTLLFDGRTLRVVNVNDRDDDGTKGRLRILCEEIRK